MKYVKTPKSMAPLFEEAEKYVEDYFKHEKRDPENGTITINGERYILVRAKSMSIRFLEFIKDKYPAFDDEDAYSAAAIFLFDMAHSIGISDARNFHKAMKVKDPIAKLSSGPVHFSFTGWANVELSEESMPKLDKSCYFVYDHPHSFEADSWIEDKKKTNKPVCFMSAGYSSGWSQESFGVELVTKEILCRARGDKCCRFIQAHPDEIDKRVEEYKKKHPELFKQK